MFYPVSYSKTWSFDLFVDNVTMYSRLMLHIMQWQMRLCVSLWYLISTHAKIQDQMAECQSFFLDISHFLLYNVITCGCCIWELQHPRMGLDHVRELLQLDKNCENGIREEKNMVFSSNFLTSFGWFQKKYQLTLALNDHSTRVTQLLIILCIINIHPDKDIKE